MSLLTTLAVSARRVLAGSALAAVAAAPLLAGTASADTGPQAGGRAPVARTSALASTPMGVQFHGMWSMYTDTQRGYVLDKLQAAGVKSVRLDVSWGMLQPAAATSYDAWGTGFVDRVIGMANARGIKPLVTLWLTPAWANHGKGERVLPDNPADYARAAGWAATRWRGKVAGWEVWNEQNSNDFLVGADAVGYTKLLRAAYPAFKAGDPTAPVVFGGLQYNDTGWLTKAYAAGARGYFDVPIWFTEFGWSTHATAPGAPNWERGVSEATQATYLSQTATLVRQQMPYVTNMYWYNERDLTTGGIQDGNYGLLRRDLSAKPALAALAVVNKGAVTAAASSPTSSQVSVTSTGLRKG